MPMIYKHFLILGEDCNKRASKTWISLYIVFMTGFEKREHFAQNAIFCHLSTCHHFTAVRVLGFRLILLAVWTFYFTDPTLEP